MSWFARSIANTLKFDEDEEIDQNSEPKGPENPESPNSDTLSPRSPSRGVKEDLSELSETLTRQFWGVASFLAPSTQPERKSGPDVSASDQDAILGIRGDFAEIGGKFRSGISRLSNNIKVSEITKMASNLLQLDSDEENGKEGKRASLNSSSEGAIGVTEEVVAFARDVSMHPETWLDFPLPNDNGDDDDFDLSDAQQEHALAVERLSPSLAALRFELCPRYISESSFWKIYFVLLHPRLDKEDAVLLSTPEILEARAMLTHELKKQKVAKLVESSDKISSDETATFHHEEPFLEPPIVPSENKPDKASDPDIDTSTAITTEIEIDEVHGSEAETVDKSVIIEKNVDHSYDKHVNTDLPDAFVKKDEDDVDDWLKEETSEIGGPVLRTIPIDNDDDVSFSDLEDDDGDVPTNNRKSNYSSDKDSRDWVQLGKTSTDVSKENATGHDNRETNDWLDVDDIVVA